MLSRVLTRILLFLAPVPWQTPAPPETPGRPPVEAAARPGPRAKGAPGRVGVEWVDIPGGAFLMGSMDFPWARPMHPVAVKAFQMAKTEVTFGQYKACVAAGECSPAHSADGACRNYDGFSWRPVRLPSYFLEDDQPAVCVDWEQARAFSRWVGGRLPTEAEWEYAARGAGGDRRFPWGDEDATCDRAVADSNGCEKGATWPVGSLPRGNTAQGLCDMAGNVWEWVEDAYHGSYRGAAADGSARPGPPDAPRVIRGGSWDDFPRLARAAARRRVSPRRNDATLGFRPVRPLPSARPTTSL